MHDAATDAQQFALQSVVSLSLFLTKSVLCLAVQLQTLVMKKGAGIPLYLRLACEDLRNFASFDMVRRKH